MKNSQLEDLLKAKGLPNKGKKDELLIERLQRYPNGYGLKGPPKQWQHAA